MKFSDLVYLGIASSIFYFLFRKKEKHEVIIQPDWSIPDENYIQPKVPPVLFSFESAVMHYKDIIMSEGAKQGVEAAIIASVIQRESSGQPNTKTWEANVNDWSWGLMQIRTTTAQWRGFKGKPEELLDPKINIYWGTEYLAYQLARYAHGEHMIKDAIAAYNAGTAKYTKKGAYINQDYVDFVLSRIPRYRELLLWAYPGYYRAFPKEHWVIT